MKWFPIVTVVTLALSAYTSAEEAEKKKSEPEGKYQVIMEVTEVKLEGTKVTASGTASSAGWKNARLEPFKEDADGIYRFKFEAQPPDGISAQVLTPIGPVEYDFKKLPANLVKVVVEAAQNKKEVVHTGTAGTPDEKKEKTPGEAAK